MPYDRDQIANLDAELDALSTPTTDEVFAHSKDYNPDHVAASAVRRTFGGAGLPAGGSTGQVLTKASDADGDADWETGSGSQPFLTAEVTLTDAEIKALGSGTAKQVVAAPGVAKVLRFVQGFVTVDAVADAYGTIDAGATLTFAWIGGSDASAPLRATDGALAAFLGGDGEISFATFFPREGNTPVVAPYDASEGENLPLAFVGFNGTGAFTGGDAANSGRIKVWYTVEDLP